MDKQTRNRENYKINKANRASFKRTLSELIKAEECLSRAQAYVNRDCLSNIIEEERRRIDKLVVMFDTFLDVL